jgi:hypothetical protein
VTDKPVAFLWTHPVIAQAAKLAEEQAKREFRAIEPASEKVLPVGEASA